MEPRVILSNLIMVNEQLIDNTFVLRDGPQLELFDAVALIRRVEESVVLRKFPKETFLFDGQ